MLFSSLSSVQQPQVISNILPQWAIKTSLPTNKVTVLSRDMGKKSCSLEVEHFC